MNYRKLGESGLTVSEIGFGAWGIGGVASGAVAYGPTSDSDSIRALRHALEAGVNFYDTSDLYGFGHSEEIIGQAFAGRRSQVIIASKVGFAGSSSDTLAKDFSARHILASLEASLRRLQTNYIDLYQLHDPPIEVLRTRDNPLSILDSLLAEGRIRAIGVSARTPADALTIANEFRVHSIQVNFNMIDQRIIENGLLELCTRKGIGIVARTPLCFGFLTGKVSSDTAFPPGDHRAAWPREQIARWASAPSLFSSVVAPRNAQTPAMLAIRYCLSYRGVSTVIPGMISAVEVDENCAASTMGPLEPAEVSAIENVYRETEFFVARRHGT